MILAEGFGQDMTHMNRRLAANVVALLFVASAANALGLCACLSDNMSDPHTRRTGHEGMATSHGHEGMATSHGHEGIDPSNVDDSAVPSHGHEGTAITHGHRGIATSHLVMDCCAMDGQPSVRGIVEERVNLKPTVEASAGVTSTVEPADLMAAAGATGQMAHRGLPTVPIYLQHLSLLI
jgi:hypothetical protein